MGGEIWEDGGGGEGGMEVIVRLSDVLSLGMIHRLNG